MNWSILKEKEKQETDNEENEEGTGDKKGR